MSNIVFVGAGSVRYTIKLVGDLAKTKELYGSRLVLMDIDEERLKATHILVTKYLKELKAEYEVEQTTSLEKALEGADFVINTALYRAPGHEDGYVHYEIMREVGERHGYYRGIDSQELNMVSDYYTLSNYNHLKMSLDIAKAVEKISPDAWILQTANPVFEITQLVKRLTKAKIVGFCHGYAHVFHLAKVVGVEPEELDWQVAGVNHAIWLNRFRWKGEDLYPRLEEWIEKNASSWEPKSPWDVDFSPAAIDMYRFYGMYPIGDTVRNGTWKYHYDLETKKRWYGKYGGIDNEAERPKFYEGLRKQRRRLMELAKEVEKDPSLELTKVWPEVFTTGSESVEQHIPFINALVNGKRVRLVLNVENRGVIRGIPDDVVVEVPVIVDKEGIHPEKIEPDLTERIKKFYLLPRILRMEWAFEAFISGDRRVLEEILIRDPRTKSYEQAVAVIDDILNLPFNEEMKKHYSG
ncbi:alpha-glucosidase AglA [Thermotoga sp. SG1]|uniref:alpha-glucosidase AglA n=1 Tax=Thermotoga sp. SG1 TaxID=126739 RepID=UPI000C776F17|nr:alpha-glucosidase AglA [Thermotoga sp. SG1]PLV56108.1 alpha-glucosidase/alpha-galactosidase [Thermotoga sp. SG1]